MEGNIKNIKLTEEQRKELIELLSTEEPKGRNRAERRRQKKHEWLVGRRGGGKSYENRF